MTIFPHPLGTHWLRAAPGKQEFPGTLISAMGHEEEEFWSGLLEILGTVFQGCRKY